jgi:hypothetical protein
VLLHSVVRTSTALLHSVVRTSSVAAQCWKDRHSVAAVLRTDSVAAQCWNDRHSVVKIGTVLLHSAAAPSELSLMSAAASAIKPRMSPTITDFCPETRRKLGYAA